MIALPSYRVAPPGRAAVPARPALTTVVRTSLRRATVALLTLTVLAGCGRGNPATADSATASSASSAPNADVAASTAAPNATHDVIRLDSASVALGGIVVGVADSTRTSGLPLTGAITYDQNRVTHIGARTVGRVVALRADLGARVARSAVLAELESPEVGQIRADERQATALLKIARENYAREERLAAQGISSRKELLDAEAEVRRNEAALRSAEDRLSVLGAGHGSGGHFDVLAPFGGVVVARRASLGQMASPNDSLFTIADLSRVWIELDVFERDLARVRPGQSAVVTVSAYPSRAFSGRVIYLADIVDPQRRTARARIELPNGDRALKPGMFARGTIQIGGDGAAVAVVPQAAVQKVQDRDVVFVPGTRSGEFRVVGVELGETLDGGRVVIRRGLIPGARVVTAGAFSLRSELAKDEIGEGEG